MNFILALLTGIMAVFEEIDTKRKATENQMESYKRCTEWQRNFDELEKLRVKKY